MPEELVEYLTQNSVGDLYRVHVRDLLVFANSILRNPDDAQEVVQDLFCSLYEKAPQGKVRNTSIRAFLFVSVKNRALNFLKTRKRTTPLLDQSSKVNEYHAIDDRMAIDAVFEYVLNNFAAEVKDIFLLRVVHSLTWQEIADITESSLSTVYRRFEEAAQSIKEKFPDVL